MTAQSSDAGSDPSGRRRPPLPVPQLTPLPGSGEHPRALPPGPLPGSALQDFLHTEPHLWGGPLRSGGAGVAALRFDATPLSVTRTRRFLRDTLTDWRLPDLVDDATAVAAELVANAVTHALRPSASRARAAEPCPPRSPAPRTHLPAAPVPAPGVAPRAALASHAPAAPVPPEVLTPPAPGGLPCAWIALLRADHAVVCAVSDPSPALPALSQAGPFAESGRGLRIVAELSETWGHSEPRPAGKTVWARLSDGR
jgi:hypothetical protein